MTLHVNKKRKTSHDVQEEAFGQIVDEIDLEIGLRRRLAEAVEARIEWASLLQQSMKQSHQDRTSIKGAAIEALDAIETSLNPMFTREPFPTTWGPRPIPVQIKDERPIPSYKPVAQPSKPSFLFIKSAHLEPSNNQGLIRTYLLRCPQCLRTAFTSLQGLLNHARISHSLEWGTHDDCVRACAVLDPDIDEEAGSEVGLGPHGLLPGLRSLFKMAVSANDRETKPMDIPGAVILSATPSDSHLTKTLGLHEDTPALAPFLGKEVLRKQIKVWEELDLDIRTMAVDTIKTHAPFKLTWKMPYSHRSSSLGTTRVDLSPESQDAHDKPFEVEELRSGSNSRSGTAQDVKSDSRFHFSTRLVLIDRSLWIPPGKRGHSQETHKWMLSVDSPSYSNHISTVLHGMSVSSFSTSKTDFAPKTTTNPPFVVVGRATQPFLAKIELSFGTISESSGQSMPQKVILDHWVELDPYKNSNPVSGDEQVVDVDLDRRTSLRPVQKNYTPIGARVLWNDEWDVRDLEPSATVSSQDHERILLGLLQEFPMTLKDVDHNQAVPLVPYKLATTSYQFKNMIPGRRKAIEWGRANAICDAYNATVPGGALSEIKLSPLSTADVFRWLSAEGHFLRPPSENLARAKLNIHTQESPQQMTWCRMCGKAQVTEEFVTKPDSQEGSNLPLKLETEDTPISNSFRTCRCSEKEVQNALPLVNILTRFGEQWDRNPSSRNSSIAMRTHSQGEIVAGADPQLVIATYGLMRRLRLPHVPSSESSSFPLAQLGSDRVSVHSVLGPAALIAMALRPFIRELVASGLVYSSGPQGNLKSGTSSKKKRPSRKRDGIFDVLTPTQVLCGVAARAEQTRQSRGDTKNIAIYELLTRLGIPVESSNALEEVNTNSSLDKDIYIGAGPEDIRP